MAVPTCVWLAKQRLLGRSLQSTCSSCIELLIDRSSMLGELLAAPPRPRRAAAKLARKSAQEEPAWNHVAIFRGSGIYYYR